MGCHTKDRFSICIYILSLLTMQLPWFVVEGKHSTIYTLYRYAVNQESEFVGAYRSQFIILVLYQVICVAYILTIFLKKSWHLNMIALFLSICLLVLSITGLETLAENLLAVCYPIVVMMLSIIEFIVPKMVEAMWAEQAEMHSKMKRDKEAKAEKKERLYFQGKYNNLFFYIIWKNFRYNWKDYVLFLACGGMAATLTFVGMGSYEIMAEFHSNGVYVIGSGLGKILWKALLPIGACVIILMVFVLLFYLKKRIVSYSMFLALGARKKTMFFMIALEIIFSLFLALVIGCLFGNAVLWILKRKIVAVLGKQVTINAVSWLTYLKMSGVILAVYLIAFMATRDIALDLNIGSAVTKKVLAEKMPGKRLTLAISIGILLCGYSMLRYAQLKNHEDIMLLGLFFLGLFLVIRYGMAWYLHREKNGKKYFTELMYRNHLYQRSKTAAWYLTVLSLVNTCAVFYFTAQVASIPLAEDTDTLFPYDYMCIADEEDEEFFQNLKDTYEIKLTEYPMVRVSTADGTPRVETRGMTPIQGQHIGISETTYHKLKKVLNEDYQEQSLEVDGKAEKISDQKVYIVHQQDRSVQAQPIEWSLFSVEIQ